jgi:hypothetical protein
MKFRFDAWAKREGPGAKWAKKSEPGMKKLGPMGKWAKKEGAGAKWAKKPGMGNTVKVKDVWWK